MAPETVSLQHPAIGSIKGIRHSSQVEEYLGIKYATLTDRFARGTLVESYASSVDATAHGPLPVANPQNCDLEQLLLQHELPHPAYSFSDKECLTLNVTAPNAEIRAKAGKPLPVLVYVHGGGYVTGSANWPQWELAKLVELSIEHGSPIIAVGINYRLGPFGFLTSGVMREAGYLPNNGLHDQKLGFRWVQKHIAGFGGDVKAMTYFGCSIGAASGFVHLQSEEPLFQRIAAWGGSGLMQPLPLGVAEVGYNMVVKALGLESLAPAEQIKQLVKIPQDEFEAKCRDVHAPYMAWVDDDIVHTVPTYSGIADSAGLKKVFPGVNWCPTVWMGSCSLDGAIFLVTALAGRQDDLPQALKRCISTALSGHADIIPQLISLYGLDSASSAKEKTIAVANFSTDVGFAQAAEASAQAWHSSTGTALLSHFTCPNPWDGGWKGYATHGLDAAFVLQNFNQFLSAGQKACAERMGRDMVDFVAGRDKLPWVGAEGGREIVYHADAGSDESKIVSSEEAAKSARRQELEKIVGGRAEVLDRLMDALGMLLSGQ
ncbi:alpha/beta-hydrolase [Coniochaeta ligniaria NRRL 30616]|uniref:Alpha/beta-hydrolase n=1 Tax=Coniochaeta ligniaria NRRL 30616 TaxID=1408157 RepID=A0A1J7IFP0_9PEZI|nr:alpha/beta-hydrolase [Coniochaeta ligniaria NRRL 30616]